MWATRSLSTPEISNQASQYQRRSDTMRKPRLTALCGTIILLTITSTGLSQSPSKNGSTQPVIKDRPEPTWPSSIKKKVEVAVVLHAIFRSNGTVTDIRRIQIKPEKPDGLSPEEIDSLAHRAIKAASKITFTPATKDG